MVMVIDPSFFEIVFPQEEGASGRDQVRRPQEQMSRQGDTRRPDGKDRQEMLKNTSKSTWWT